MLKMMNMDENNNIQMKKIFYPHLVQKVTFIRGNHKKMSK